MLQKVTPADFDRWVAWAYGLAMTEKHSSYPTYRDGVKSREQFISRSRRGLEDEKILLFLHDGRVRGWLHWYAIETDHYAGTHAFLVEDHAEQAVKEFTQYLAQRMSGAALHVGLPAENTALVQALEQHGFTLLDDSVNHTLFFATYRPKTAPACVRPLDEKGRAEFRRLHNDPDMYWNAERILRDIARWRCYLYWQGNRAVGALCCMMDGDWPEIFSIDFENNVFRPEVYRGLLTACLNESKAHCRFLSWFDGTEAAQPILLELGFRRVDRYLCYHKQI